MKKINIQILYVSTCFYILILIPSFLAAWAEDEGTLGTSIIWISFCKLFYVLRFPTHVLFWSFITEHGGTVYLSGLFINCCFYGLVTERAISLLKKKKI